MAWLFRRKKNDTDDTGGKTGSSQLGRVAGVTGEADSDSETSTGAISPADTGSSSSRQSDGSSTGRSSEEETLVDGQQSEYGAMAEGDESTENAGDEGDGKVGAGKADPVGDGVVDGMVVCALLLFAVALGSGSAGNVWSISTSRPFASGDQALHDDVVAISTGVGKAAVEHREAVDELLYDSPSPSGGQLRDLGGWKLELKRSKAENGKQHVVVTNVAGPGGDEKTVWEGDLESGDKAKSSISTALETALDGTATDSLVTRQYSVVGELPTVNESKSADDSGDSGNAVIAAKQCPSAVALVEGDSDARAASLKTVGKVKANRTVEADPDAGSGNGGDSSSADASSWPGPGDARVAWYSDGERVAG